MIEPPLTSLGIKWCDDHDSVTCSHVTRYADVKVLESVDALKTEYCDLVSQPDESCEKFK